MSAFRKNIASLLLPAVVFGYAAYSNVALLSKQNVAAQAAQIGAVSMSGMFDGEVTRDLDSSYKKELPHRAAAVGLSGNVRYSVFRTGRKGVVVGDDGWLFTNEEFKDIPPSDISDSVRRIKDIEEQLKAQGIALVILPLPAKSDIYATHLPRRLQSDAMARAYESFAGELASAGVATVDIRSTFMAAQASAGVFLKSDTHWSPNGAQIAADVASIAVTGMGLHIETAAVKQLPQQSATLWGDLTKFITLPEYADGIGLKQETVQLFRTEVEAADAGLDVFGDGANVPVMLVGTSYSANENWSFVDYLRKSLSVDVVNVAKEGIGPGVPMLDLLQGDTLRQSKPKIVIWEFPVRYLGSRNLWQREGTVVQGHGLKDEGGANG